MRSRPGRTGQRPTRSGAALDEEFGQIDGCGTLLYSRARLLSAPERYDLGWFVACLCTPLLGEDLAARPPRYRPGSLPARRPLVRFMSRHLHRTGFTLVMPHWGGWTSDLHEMAEAFARYCPQRGGRLRAAAVLGRDPAGDAEVLASYVDDPGPWLAAEYARVHGEKTPGA